MCEFGAHTCLGSKARQHFELSWARLKAHSSGVLSPGGRSRSWHAVRLKPSSVDGSMKRSSCTCRARPTFFTGLSGAHADCETRGGLPETRLGERGSLLDRRGEQGCLAPLAPDSSRVGFERLWLLAALSASPPSGADGLDGLLACSATKFACTFCQWQPNTQLGCLRSTIPSWWTKSISGRTRAINGLSSQPQQLSRMTRLDLNVTLPWWPLTTVMPRFES